MTIKDLLREAASLLLLTLVFGVVVMGIALVAWGAFV